MCRDVNNNDVWLLNSFLIFGFNFNIWLGLTILNWNNSTLESSGKNDNITIV